MDFPASMPEPVNAPNILVDALGVEPQEILSAFDYVVVLNNENEVQNIEPDFLKLQDLDLRGVLVTAPGDSTDFVSRCFFPKYRVNEDPVTGSAHCELAPYWGKKLGLEDLKAKQLSQRMGVVNCTLTKNRVILSGNAADYMQGTINLKT